MFLTEPSRTPYDLQFSFLGIPVRVHPFFWLGSLILGWGGSRPEPIHLILWVAVVFLSILVHELGHAVTAKRFGASPWITLYAFGGLASYDRGVRSSGERLAVIAAGPGAGFMLAAIVLLALVLSGHQIGFLAAWADDPGNFARFLGPGDGSNHAYIGFGWIGFDPFPNSNVNRLIGNLLFVNIMWGVLNLFPIFPLDGGQISRELFVRHDPYNGFGRALVLSMIACGGLVIYALYLKSNFMAIFFGLLGVSSWQLYQANSGRGGWGRW